jgi:HK97 family phage major capsid protein
MYTDERLRALTQRRETLALERSQKIEERQAIADIAEEESRTDLTEVEDAKTRSLTADVKLLDQQILNVDERIQELSEEMARDSKLTEGGIAVRRAQARVSAIQESATYTKENRRMSYFQDLMRVSLNQDATGESGERLRRHATDVATLPEYRDLNRTDGNGGYFVPPAWLMNEYIELARPARAYANLVDNQALPGGTDSINIPKVATGTQVDVQNGDNTPVTEVDLTDTFISAPVRTVAGQQDVAIQLLDQSPVNFDQVIFRDLLADYAAKVDKQVLTGSGTAGQVLGVHNTSGIQTIVVAGNTVGAFYSAVADGIQRVYTQRFQPPTHIVMHPRRWAFLTAALDAAQRPLVGIAADQPMNSIANLSAVGSQMVVGSMQGLPIVTDPNIGTAYGTESGGGTEDLVYVQRSSDITLYESGIRTRVLQEVGSGTLTVRLQVYGYLAFTAARYPKSVVEISGLVAPTF